MKLNTLHDLFIHEIQDLYSAETQITKALPKMIEGATSPKLQKAFEMHLEETEKQIERLEKLSEELDINPKGHTCKGMQGLLKEGEEILSLEGNTAVIDAALIGAAQRVEHYEIAGYGCAITYAKLMKHNNAVKLLKETIDEEEETDKKLSKIAETEVNKEAND
jgi:ferritin-like metal-binding protein YciE